MTRNKKLKVAAAFTFMVMSVAIICFGSLINFHQYKIWGKPLIPTFTGYKRDVEKYHRVHAGDYPAGGSANTTPDFLAGADFGPAAYTQPTLSWCYLRTGETASMPSLHLVTATGLRGPPVC
ncbi:MAG TPA: hypothetical protein PKG48_14845 [Bacteroidales bacterium]|nr:hypothetical protein [Bacteroidales bacterium]